MTQIIIGISVGLIVGGLGVFVAVRKIATKRIEDFIVGLGNSQETIRQFLSKWLSEKELDDYLADIKERLTSRIYNRFAEPSVSDKVSQLVVSRLADKLSKGEEKKEEPSRRGFFGNALHFMGDALRSRVEVAVENNQETIGQILSGKINEAIKGNGKEVISSIIDSEVDRLLSQQVSSLFKDNERMIALLKQRIMLF